ncbi:MAG: CDP-alcohol phosphatidyltransferase family protein [Candidatus Bipolaricaulota bacterium]
MSLANAVTLFRGLLLVPTVYLLFRGERGAAAALFAVACAGDVVDGTIARARNEVTTLGKVLDPIVDKSLYVALLSSLLVLGAVPMWAYAAFLLPQVALGVGALALATKSGAVQAARPMGKAASFLSFVGLFFLLVDWPGGREIFFAAVAATYAAGADYYLAARRLGRAGP